jgi:hypothetical protein
MVKVDMVIDFQNSKIEIHLLKREDWTEDEWNVAKSVEGLYGSIIEESGVAEKIFHID